MIMRLARAIAPGLDAKAVAHELRLRVMEELDYEYEAQSHRSFARAYRGHPFINVPDVITRLSRRRVLVTEYVEGIGFEEVKQLPQSDRDRFGEIVFRFCFGSIYHLQMFNADAHPGNYILLGDGRVAFLDFGMTKRLDVEQIELEQRAIDAAARRNPEALREALHDLGFVKNPSKFDAERLMEHVMVVGGWYMEDRDVQLTPERVMKVIESTSDPRSEYFDLMRRESLPAEEFEDIAGKVLAIFFPIMAFVAIGFDHVVANMFFIPAAIFAPRRPLAALSACSSTPGTRAGLRLAGGRLDHEAHRPRRAGRRGLEGRLRHVHQAVVGVLDDRAVGREQR